MSCFVLVLSLFALLAVGLTFLIKNLSEGLEEMIFKFADDTKMGGLAQVTDYKIRIPTDFCRLKCCVDSEKIKSMR